MDHLREVPGTDLARVDEALLARAVGTQRVEDRHGRIDVRPVPADHEPVAVLEAPDAARDADVEVADALLGQLRGPRLVLGVVGVPALDDEVALAEQATELGDHAAGRLARRDHDPHDARAVVGQRGHEVGERRDIGHLGTRVVADDLDAGGADARPHVVAHLAEADEADARDHTSPPGCGGAVRAVRLRRGQPAKRIGTSR
ncbi:Uncharacterised protein [Mycobacteroides abscessus]|nr:Uncharacterised protein [Mycobacteroides abscessus]